MKTRIVAQIAVAALFSMGARTLAQGLEGIHWQRGPSTGDLGGTAQVRIPEGYVFAGPADTQVLMEAMKNPTSGTEKGFVSPAEEDWFVVFEFDEVGYVRDDEKNSLDAGAMLESIKEGTAAGNEERRRRGWPTLEILGWELPPRYNGTTHNLEWAVRGQSEGKPVVNHNTRLLGRNGVMRVTLVTDPATLPSTLPKFEALLAGFEFVPGHKYAEFRPGDKVAKYGLTALVVGGASAVAVKTGFFKWAWKGLVVLLVAAGGLLKKLFSRRKSEYTTP